MALFEEKGCCPVGMLSTTRMQFTPHDKAGLPRWHPLHQLQYMMLQVLLRLPCNNL